MVSTLLLLASVILPSYAHAKTIPDSRVYECFKKYPIMSDSIEIYSNEDWKDRKKSAERVKQIKKIFAKDPNGLKDCREDVVANSTQGLGVHDSAMTIERMREITDVIYTNSRGTASTSSGTNR